MNDEEYGASFDPVSLIDEIRKSPGYDLRERLGSFDTSLYTFERNSEELVSLARFLTSDDPRATKLLNLNARDEMLAMRVEVARRVHKFVAAAVSLIDHTRVIYKELYTQVPSFAGYEARIASEFARDPLSQFIKGLRQYCVHCAVPRIGVHVSMTRRGEGFDCERTVFIPLADLSAYDAWKQPAKTFLASVKSARVDLLQVTENYRNKVRAFYAWFTACQSEVHQEDLANLARLEGRFAAHELRRSINICLANPGEIPSPLEYVFVTVLSSSEIHELASTSLTAQARTERVIAVLENRVEMSPDLCARISRFFAAMAL